MMSRCIPSVQAQDYQGEMEHIIQSDGANPEVWASIRLNEDMGVYQPFPINFMWQGKSGDGYGARVRLKALERATGDYIGYLDDDDKYRPEHVRLLAQALDDHPECGFAYSCMVFHHSNGNVSRSGIQGPGKVYGTCGTPTILHRREILAIHTWGEPGPYEDYELVKGWIAAGIKHVQVETDTVDVWPSSERGY
jgi:glycosyltransferase involved in cell wall biosynthesis